MSIKFGSARRDENGRYKNGSSGDNDKKEVSTQSVYVHNKGWLGFVPIKLEHRIALSNAMKDACNNDNIGYDQNNRNDIIQAFKSAGYKIKNIVTKCECDCSSLLRVCIWEATGVDIGNCTTASLPAKIRKTNLFREFEVKTTNDMKQGGCAYVTKTKGHCGITIDDTLTTETVKTYITVNLPELSKGDKGDYVGTLQLLLESKGYSVGKSGVDKSFGDDTLEAVKEFQKANGLKVDGIVGTNTWSKLLI